MSLCKSASIKMLRLVSNFFSLSSFMYTNITYTFLMSRVDSIQIDVYCNTQGVIMIINKAEAQDILDAIEVKIDDLERTHKTKDRLQILRLQDLYMELTKFILTGAES